MAANELIILTIAGGITIGHILFLAAYLWIKGRTWLPHRLLAALLFFLTIRVVKSIFLLAFPGLPFANALIALGVIGMSATGPLIYFYSRYLLHETFKLKRSSFIHFIPALLLSFTAFFLTDNQMFQVYQLTVYHIFLYIILSIRLAVKARKSNPSHYAIPWLYEYLGACILMAIIFATQLYTGNRLVYISVSIGSAIILYAISLRTAFNKEFIQSGAKRKKKPQSPELLKKISQALRENQLYLDPMLTVHKLSHTIKIPAHIISSTINEETRAGFSEYINEYRIHEAEKRLISNEWAHFSIEAIAYDSGFNSLSAFYNSFKKVKNISPAKFRKENSS